ncbi:MAG: site-2 protease family protein [Desulfosarcina sp.]|nr:site-2 protease family protein [Desulfosarcina sp.]
MVHWQRGQSLGAALVGVLFILTIFLFVVLHEFGHALMARHYGIATRDIILLPIGGVARLEKIPSQPMQEFWVALAGPAVNVVIAAALFVWLQATASWEPLQRLTVTTGPLLERLMAVNLFMIVFNMIPAFPLDGGRVLRAALATRLNYNRATQIAASIGRAIAVLFGLMGLFYNPFLFFIAVFVWLGATQESALTRMKAAVGGIPVHQVMVSEFKSLAADDSLQRAADLTLTGTQKDFPVVSDGILEGVLRQTDLAEALSKMDAREAVASIIRKHTVSVESTEMMDTVVAKLNECRCDLLPVTREGKLVGVVTIDNLGALVRLREAAAN